MTAKSIKQDNFTIEKTRANDPPADLNFTTMCLLAFCVGVVGGPGAWFFRVLIGLIHNLMFFCRMGPPHTTVK